MNRQDREYPGKKECRDYRGGEGHETDDARPKHVKLKINMSKQRLSVCSAALLGRCGVELKKFPVGDVTAPLPPFMD